MADPIELFLGDVVPRGASAHVVGSTPASVLTVLRERCADVAVTAGAAPADDPTARSVLVVGDVSASGRQGLDAMDDAVTLLEPGGVLVVLASAQVAPAHLEERLTALHRGLPSVHHIYGDSAGPLAIVRTDTAASACTGSFADALLGAVFDPTEPPAAYDGLIGVVGGRGRAIYATAHGSSLWADHEPGQTHWVTSHSTVPDAPTFEHTLRDLLAEQDRPRFRAAAARVGTWLRTHSDAADLGDLAFDRLLDIDGESFLPVTVRERPELQLPTTPATGGPSTAQDTERLAHAWRRFVARLDDSDRSAVPWPPLTTDEELVSSWLAMSGVEDPAAAAEPAPETSTRRDAERMRLLEARVELLTEMLEKRDSQLMVREASIYRLHKQLLGQIDKAERAELQSAQLRNQRSYKVARRAGLVLRPKEFARAAGNKLERRIRTIRRMR